MRARVVVTGAGAVSPQAADLPGTWKSLVEGCSGIREIPGMPGPLAIGGQAAAFDAEAVLGMRVARQYDRFAQMAIVAAREARSMAGVLDHPGGDRWSVVIGTGLGGIGAHESAVTALTAGQASVSAYTAVAMVPSAATAAVAIETGARGPALTPATACASGTDAIGLGADLIRAGRADVVLAGGADAPLTRAMFSAFTAIGAAARHDGDPATACRPFAADRTGLVPGEGAAVLVLESWRHARARGAAILAEVLGYAATNDAHHLSAPAKEGRAAASAVSAALYDARVRPGDVGYVNAHGTGTRFNDRIEARVLAAILGDTVPVSATKSMTGHLMGASGALEAAICLQVLSAGTIPATQNCDRLDPECACVDVVRGLARHTAVSVTLSTSFGFGGHNAALLLAQP